MIISNKILPGTLAERVAFVQNFYLNLQPVAPLLGITVAEMAALNLDVEDYAAVAQTTFALETYTASVRQYRLSLTEGAIGDPQPVFPSENFAPPPNNRPAGFFQRLSELIARIRAAPAYTPEIGAALGIIPSQSGTIPPSDAKSIIEVFPSQTGYMFSIVVSNRADADAWTVMVQPKGGAWANAGTFTGKSADVVYAPATPGEPVMISVRVQLKRKNENYGQLS